MQGQLVLYNIQRAGEGDRTQKVGSSTQETEKKVEIHIQEKTQPFAVG